MYSSSRGPYRVPRLRCFYQPVCALYTQRYSRRVHRLCTYITSALNREAATYIGVHDVLVDSTLASLVRNDTPSGVTHGRISWRPGSQLGPAYKKQAWHAMIRGKMHVSPTRSPFPLAQQDLYTRFRIVLAGFHPSCRTTATPLS